MGCYAADFRSEFWLVTCCKISQQQSDYLTEGTASCSSVQISPVQIFLQSLRGQFRFLLFRTLFAVQSQISPVQIIRRSVQISPVRIFTAPAVIQISPRLRRAVLRQHLTIPALAATLMAKRKLELEPSEVLEAEEWKKTHRIPSMLPGKSPTEKNHEISQF